MINSIKNILLVEDDQVYRERLAKALLRRGLVVYQADSIQNAKKCLAQHEIDGIVLDLKLKDQFGLDLLPEIKGQYPKAKIVVLTAYGTISTAVSSVKLGAVDFLTKPISVDYLLDALNQKVNIPARLKAPVLSQVEWDHIQTVLNDCDQNISKAAKVLGLHRRTLQRKLNKDPGKLN